MKRDSERAQMVGDPLAVGIAVAGLIAVLVLGEIVNRDLGLVAALLMPVLLLAWWILLWIRADPDELQQTTGGSRPENGDPE
jgi:hypothetical protein